MSINWLVSRLKADVNGRCEINHLYNSYKFEMLDSGFKENTITQIKFVDFLKSLFKNSAVLIRKRKGKSQDTFYSGISLKPLCEEENRTITFSEIIQYAPQSMQLVSQTDDMIQYNNDSGCLCNGNKVMKELTFNTDGHFTVTVSGKELNLEKLYVDSTYQMNKASISTVFKVVDILQLCSGQVQNRNVNMSRYHTLENWTCNGEMIRSVRSFSCLRAVTINSKNMTCRVCQQRKEYVPTNLQENDDSELGRRNSIQKLFPCAPTKMINFLVEQSKNSRCSPKGRRWSTDFIVTCLQLYSRSPKCYEHLQASGLLVLPSKSVLILYKNSLKQEPGFDEHVFQWMFEEANRLKISDDARIGGIIFDEMTIQQDIEMRKKGSVFELSGFTELGEEGDLCQSLKNGDKGKVLGTHVLQLLFLGINGFRFPFAHFVKDSVQSSQLYGLFWKAVYLLSGFGFKVLYTCMDGAQSNRNFLHTCLGEKPEIFQCPSPCTSNPLTFIMDISHVLKKIRNNILKSGIKKTSTRLLTLPNTHQIQWQMVIDFFNWDQQNALQIHRKLTKEHVFLDNQMKMRNYLAFDVLDSTMLHSIITYKKALGEKGKVLDGLIELLEQTSQLVNIFQDRRPITSFSDNRLIQLKAADSWFKQWEQNTAQSDKSKMLMSLQCHEDIHCCINGFISLCESVLSMKTSVYVNPSLINSDVIENIFNQQRTTYNGANTNPSALQYRQTINSIIIGENSISKKANAGRSSKAIPYPIAVKLPHKKRQKPEQGQTSVGSIKVLRM